MGEALQRVAVKKTSSDARAIAAAQAEPFDLARDLLVRFYLVVEEIGVEGTSKSPKRLLIVGHHICLDARSCSILCEDLHSFLLERRDRVGSPKAPITPDLAFLAYESCQHGGNEASVEVVAYWKELLTCDRSVPFRPNRFKGLGSARSAAAGAPPSSSPGPGSGSGVVWFSIPASVADALRSQCRAWKCTLFQAALAAWSLCLSGLADDDDDLVLGNTFDLRGAHAGSADFSGAVGSLSGILPLRIRLKPESAFSDVAVAAGMAARAAMQHLDVSLLVLISALKPTRTSPGVNPLFSSNFSYVNLARPGAAKTSPQPRARAIMLR